MVPKRIFFTKGVGKHRERLTSFELALRAHVRRIKQLRVPGVVCLQARSRSTGLKYLTPAKSSCRSRRKTAPAKQHRAGVQLGVAIPSDRNTYGYLSEPPLFASPKTRAGDYAEELAAEMLAPR